MSSPREPLSWLLLERYALGELSASERAEVEAQLASSPADRAVLDAILSDESELPALPDALSPAAPSPRALPARTRARWLGWSAGLCAAAAALVVVLRGAERASGPDTPEGIKGSDVTFRMWSERQGSDPKTFSAGERFKLEVTCPPRLGSSLRLFVIQGDEVFEPLPRAAPFPCGNLAPWPGAFALDGESAAQVCLYWGASARPDKRDLAGDENVRCTRLEAL